jgi:acetyltransferase-like isoleucine patch superfamily enzyme
MKRPAAKDAILNAFLKVPQHFFPLFVISLWISSFYMFVQTKEYYYFAATILIPYLIPLFFFRLLTFIYPFEEGAQLIGLEQKKFSVWLAGYRIQQIYLVFPQLERLLFFLPEMYSTWLRLWGSKIGLGVFWVPGNIINDRNLLNIGSRVVFGHQVYISAHLLRAKNEQFLLYVKQITIGSHSFIGAFSKLGPGTIIKEGTVVNAGSYYTVNKTEAANLMPDY